MSANKRRGTRWEVQVRDYLNEAAHLNVYRPAQEGFRDTGDIHGVPFFTVQCKDWREVQAAIRDGLDGVQKQKEHAGQRYGVNIVKRARKPVGAAYAVMTLEDYRSLMDLLAFLVESYRGELPDDV